MYSMKKISLAVLAVGLIVPAVTVRADTTAATPGQFARTQRRSRDLSPR